MISQTYVSLVIEIRRLRNSSMRKLIDINVEMDCDDCNGKGYTIIICSWGFKNQYTCMSCDGKGHLFLKEQLTIEQYKELIHGTETKQ